MRTRRSDANCPFEHQAQEAAFASMIAPLGEKYKPSRCLSARELREGLVAEQERKTQAVTTPIRTVTTRADHYLESKYPEIFGALPDVVHLQHQKMGQAEAEAHHKQQLNELQDLSSIPLRSSTTHYLERKYPTLFGGCQPQMVVTRPIGLHQKLEIAGESVKIALPASEEHQRQLRRKRSSTVDDYHNRINRQADLVEPTRLPRYEQRRADVLPGLATRPQAARRQAYDGLDDVVSFSSVEFPKLAKHFGAYEDLRSTSYSGGVKCAAEYYQVREKARGRELAKEGKISKSSFSDYFDTPKNTAAGKISWDWNRYYYR